MQQNKLTEIIETSLEQIKQVVDANTIIGTPINTPAGTTIIPVSKVMVGFASGGVDFLGKNIKPAVEKGISGVQSNFGGGGGTGVTVQPVGFLVVAPDGGVELLNIENGGSGDKFDSISSLIEKSPDIVQRFTAIFRKDRKSEDKNEETVVEESED